MAIIKAVSSKASIGAAIKYVAQEKKTEGLVSGINCNSETAVSEMETTKKLYEKESGRQYKHYVQSFHSYEKVKPEQAHEIATKLAKEKFAGFEVLIATHTDKGHLHTHFIVNSVSFETGKKYQESRQDLQELKNKSDEICLSYGLQVESKIHNGRPTAWTMDKHQAIKKENSYLQKIFVAVKEAKETSENRQDFVKILAEKKITVDWQDSHKYVVFVDENGKKARDKNLEKTFKEEFSKEAFEKEFKIRFQKERRQELDKLFKTNNYTGAELKELVNIDRIGEALKKETPATQHELRGFFNSVIGAKLLQNQTIHNPDTFVEIAHFFCTGNQEHLQTLSNAEKESIKELATRKDETATKKTTQEVKQEKKKEHGWGMGY